MIRRVTIRNFKCLEDQTFELTRSVVLAGANNSGKSTLLQALMTWQFVLERWHAERGSRPAIRRTGIAIPRAELTAVPLREMSLLWHDRCVAGPRGMAGPRRLIEISVDGSTGTDSWHCGVEIEYASRDRFYARPLGAARLSAREVRAFPPEGARGLDIVHVPPPSPYLNEGARPDRGPRDADTGLPEPGHILRTLLHEIADTGPTGDWIRLTTHVRDLFGIDLLRPVSSPDGAHVMCAYREGTGGRALDLCSAGSGTLQVLLVLAFLYSQPAPVILLDLPDACQQQVLRKRVHALLGSVVRDRRGQIIVATHSDSVLDAAPPGAVIGLFGGTPRRLAAGPEDNRMRDALRQLTTNEIRLVRRTGSVLYVPNRSHEWILATWARILDHPASAYLGKCCVHRVGNRGIAGARAHFLAMKSLQADVTGLCLVDGKTPDELDAETAGSGLALVRWRRHEIANYLLHPDAIVRFTGLPLMRDLVERRFRQNTPGGTDLPGDHGSLVRVRAGTEFLIPLLRELGREVPERDLYLLAAAMIPEEIHPEVREKLDLIAERLVPG